MREAESVPARAEALPPPGVGVAALSFSKKRFISVEPPKNHEKLADEFQMSKFKCQMNA